MAGNTGKTEIRLRVLEAELVRELTAALPAATRNNSTFFFSSRYNPHALSAHMLSPQTEELVSKAEEILSLRKALLLPTESSMAYLFLEACAEISDLRNEQRLGPRRLAQRLLDRLDELPLP